MKHADWYDYENKKRIDGKWPPVGDTVELSDYPDVCFSEGVIVGLDSFELASGIDHGFVIRCGSRYEYKSQDEVYFRPIDWNHVEVEAEKQLRRIASIQRAIQVGVDTSVAEKLYDAGLLVGCDGGG